MYEFPITVEFEDIDNYGIAHHTKFIYYLERTRVHFFEDNRIDLKKLSYGIVLRNLSMNFKSALQLLDKIVVELRTKNIDKFRFEFDYVIKRDGKVTSNVTIEMVTIDLAFKRIIEIPDEMRKLLEKIRID